MHDGKIDANPAPTVLDEWRPVHGTHYVRGRLPSDPKDVPSVPWECRSAAELHTKPEASARYWAHFGYPP